MNTQTTTTTATAHVSQYTNGYLDGSGLESNFTQNAGNSSINASGVRVSNNGHTDSNGSIHVNASVSIDRISSGGSKVRKPIEVISNRMKGFGTSYNGHDTFIANEPYEMGLGYIPYGKLESACDIDICGLSIGPKLKIGDASLDLNIFGFQFVKQAYIQVRNYGLRQTEYYQAIVTKANGAVSAGATGRYMEGNFIWDQKPILGTDYRSYGIKFDVFNDSESYVVGANEK